MADSVFNLLFVCTGNTCRSPLAEVLALREVEARGWDGRVSVRSAGVATFEGAPASTGSVTVANDHGLDLSLHRSSLLTETLVAEADLVLGMSRTHVARALELDPESRVELLGGVAVGLDAGGGVDVPDPFGGPVAVYEDTYRVLDELVGMVMDRLDETLKAR